MTTRALTISATILLIASLAAQEAHQPNELFRRRLRRGSAPSVSLMKAENNGNKYQVRITATTKRRSDSQFVEEFAWSGLEANGSLARRPLSPAAEAFRLRSHARRWTALRDYRPLEDARHCRSGTRPADVLTPTSSWRFIRTTCVCQAIPRGAVVPHRPCSFVG